MEKHVAPYCPNRPDDMTQPLFGKYSLVPKNCPSRTDDLFQHYWMESFRIGKNMSLHIVWTDRTICFMDCQVSWGNVTRKKQDLEPEQARKRIRTPHASSMNRWVYGATRLFVTFWAMQKVNLSSREEKQKRHGSHRVFFKVVPPGIEPGTHGFSVRCSTIWAKVPSPSPGYRPRGEAKVAFSILFRYPWG